MLHTALVSYQRPSLTVRAVESYLDTVSVPHTLVVVDNGSDKHVVDKLIDHRARHGYRLLLLSENRYPGYATNRGWERAPATATLLHRADNDFVFLPGWCKTVLTAIGSKTVLTALGNKPLGQLGLRTADEELHNPHNVGGNCVILRQLWDDGLRWDERPWGPGYPAGHTEDSVMSPAVRSMGYDWGRVSEPCIVPISNESPDDPDYAYYQRSWALRGITP